MRHIKDDIDALAERIRMNERMIREMHWARLEVENDKSRASQESDPVETLLRRQNTALREKIAQLAISMPLDLGEFQTASADGSAS